MQALLAGPPIADPNVVKDEAFVVHESPRGGIMRCRNGSGSASSSQGVVVQVYRPTYRFEQLIEDAGPVCYISTLCGKFIQRNGIAVTGIIGSPASSSCIMPGDPALIFGHLPEATLSGSHFGPRYPLRKCADL